MRVLLARTTRASPRPSRRHGAAVDVAVDGDKALFLARVCRYDVMVLDRDPPEMHWADLCRALSVEKPITKIRMLSSPRGEAILERAGGRRGSPHAMARGAAPASGWVRT